MLDGDIHSRCTRARGPAWGLDGQDGGCGGRDLTGVPRPQERLVTPRGGRSSVGGAAFLKPVTPRWPPGGSEACQALSSPSLPTGPEASTFKCEPV